VVRAYDVRAAAKEEVQSLGATFVELGLETQDGSGGYAREQSEEYLAKQQELMAAEVAASDVVITTAADPRPQGPGPGDHRDGGGMAEGSVIVDLAADSGGNCELSVAGPGRRPPRGDRGRPLQPAGLHAHPRQLPLRPQHRQLPRPPGQDGELTPDFDDEIVAGTCVVRAGDRRPRPHAEALGRGEGRHRWQRLRTGPTW
jgi:NAD(P) transhydrogenase subunit alpha